MVSTAIIGSGPYGLSIAAHLRSRHVPFRIFGEPMDNWLHHMPAGMALKSLAFATNLSDPDRRATLENYCSDNGIPYDGMYLPVSLDLFTAYGLDFQRRFVPNVERHLVSELQREGDGFLLSLENGEEVHADNVVVATGITNFAKLPEPLQGFPESLVSHSFAHHDLSHFAGRDVTVIGAGASAVEIATLLQEAGAHVSLVARGGAPYFYPIHAPGTLSTWFRISHPPAALSHSWSYWLYERRPSLFRRLPPRLRTAIVRRALGPATPSTMKDRFEAGVAVSVGERVVRAHEDQGRMRLELRSEQGVTREVHTDHVIAATGYRPTVFSVPFVDEELLSGIRTNGGMPVLSGRFESSVPGLFFAGPLAANSFGPLVRHVSGTALAAGRVADGVARRVRSRAPVESTAALEAVR